ncbi:3'-5' exonuclease [Oleoguttula sp. CCFEE 5521]
MSTYVPRATQPYARFDLIYDDEPAGLDGEFIDTIFTDRRKNGSRFARVAVTNTIGQTIIDVCPTYDKEPGLIKKLPPKSVGDFGVDWPDLEYKKGARNGLEVEQELVKLLANRPVVVHAGKGDAKAFYYLDGEDFFAKHCQLFDTQEMYSHLAYDGAPSLKTCASAVLGKSVQVGGHTPVEDAQTAMELYLPEHPYDRTAAAARRQQGSFVPKALITEYDTLFADLHAKKAVREQKAAKTTAKTATFDSKKETNGSAKKKARKAKRGLSSDDNDDTGLQSQTSIQLNQNSNCNVSFTINAQSVGHIITKSVPMGTSIGPLSTTQTVHIPVPRGTIATAITTSNGVAAKVARSTRTRPHTPQQLQKARARRLEGGDWWSTTKSLG